MTARRKFALGMTLLFLSLPDFAFARTRVVDAPAAELLEYIPEPSAYEPPPNIPEISAEKSGSIPAKPGLTLRLTADPGNVRVITDESTQVTYHVVLDADSRDPGAADFLKQFSLEARKLPTGVSLDAQLPWRTFHGQFGITFEVHVPRHFNLRINTQGGNIEIQDIDGQIDVMTGGGNITVGRVGVPATAGSPHSARLIAHLESQGGHITVGDVEGDLRAITAGGHITAGDIAGDGILRTGGGQIQAGRITGVSTLETAGGNISVERPGSTTRAETSGGQIEFGQIEGSIKTHTGGGAIHIDQVTGSATVETTGGAVFLRQIDAPVRITSVEGDMVVYLPRHLAANVEALVERGEGRRILSDPSLPLNIRYSATRQHEIHGVGELNGGGKPIHLRATSGNIILRLGEPRIRAQRASGPGYMPVEAASSSGVQAPNSDDDAGFFEDVRRMILESWWGGVPVDAAEMQNHLAHSVAPVYPDVARKAGVEGDVVLRVYVSGDGRVTDLKVLDGPPILARAAVEAVRQWQYRGLNINGRPTNVVTTLIVAFRLK